MLQRRSSGVLLHPTSLPGIHGIGDLGPAAHDWVDTLADMGCSYWQVLPLGPTGYGDSPYQCFSSFAGNPNLVSPDMLVAEGLLTLPDGIPNFEPGSVNYGQAIGWKTDLLDLTYETFRRVRPPTLVDEFDEFVKREAHWLDDFTMFMVIKQQQGGGSFTGWTPDLRDRSAAALSEVRDRAGEQIRRVAFGQFLFFRQWHELRSHAAELNIQIIGDLPIFAAADSADVWANRSLFELDEHGVPTLIAGVPPDYFSPTGQLWGNPQYRWGAHEQAGFAWWLDRLGATLNLVDLLRVDHFRAFADYWEIPAGSPTAETGRWVDGPGAAFFEAVGRRFPEMPIIAEDLGEISQSVFDLRDQFELPGMKILQFAFDGDIENPFLPHNYPENCVVYTGTHDNDTTVGWWASATDAERHEARTYLGVNGSDIAWDLIRAGWESPARLAIAPLQDLLSLDGSARMNVPGQPAGNWNWQRTDWELPPEITDRMRTLNEQTDR